MQMPVKSQAAAHVSEQPTRELSEFLASIRYEQLPQTVVDRTEDLFLDWLASALAGRDARPVAAMEHFASMMGPAEGASEILTTRRKSSPRCPRGRHRAPTSRRRANTGEGAGGSRSTRCCPAGGDRHR